MDKFSSALRGYDKDEVNKFIDDIIAKVEGMVEEISSKDKKIVAYKKAVAKQKRVIKELTEKIEKLEEEKNNTKEFITDDTYERAKIDSKMILDSAKVKSNKIIEEAKDNADLIIKECLMEAKKSEMRLNTLKQEIERLKQMKETLYYN